MNEITTAELLGQYRRDLKAQGFTDEEAFSLIRRAAHEYARDGIAVSATEGCENCAAAMKAARAWQEFAAAVTRKGGE